MEFGGTSASGSVSKNWTVARPVARWHRSRVSDASFVVRPIGVMQSPFTRKVDAPRQPRAALAIEGRIALLPELAHAIEDLEGFEHVWVLSWMDRAGGFRPKVQPPRSHKKRGVLATRSPHRPNPIGLSVMELVRVEGTVLHVRGVDLLDGTPILDVKPYVPWTDAVPRSRVGWLEGEGEASGGERPEDPRGAYEVTFGAEAQSSLRWLEARGVELEATLRTILETSPLPHPYRRIRKEGDGFVLALSEWRASFRVAGKRVFVDEIRSGHRASELDAHPLHRAFVERFVERP